MTATDAPLAPALAPSASRAAHARRGAARALPWAAAVAAVVVVGAAGWRATTSRSAPAVRYQTATVDRGRIVAKVTASGALSAIVTVQVGSQVSGRIEHLYVDYGSPVRAGQLVATIEPSLFRAAAQQARANYVAAKAASDKAIANRVLAERSYARELALFAQNLASRQDLDAAEAQAESARADVGSADAAVMQT